MMDVTSSASVHCRLFLRLNEPFGTTTRAHGFVSRAIAVKQEHERSPQRIPVTPGFSGWRSSGIGHRSDNQMINALKKMQLQDTK